jgi:hypothetical protein
MPPWVAAAPLNLLRNADFDQDTRRWSTTDSSEMPLRFSGWASIEDPVRGGGSLVLVTTFEAGAHSAVQCVAVEPGVDYAVSARMLNSTSSTEGNLVIVWFARPSCDEVIASESAFIVSGEADWQQRSSQLIAPPSARSALISPQVVDLSAGDELARIFYDDLHFGPSGVEAFDCAFEAFCIDGQPGDRRFAIGSSYQTSLGGGSSGTGQPVPLRPLEIDRGLAFWLFSPDNPEILIKVLDGCAINGNFWVFYSATTNVGFQIQVSDRASGRQWIRNNPDGTTALPQQDVEAFPCG